MSKAIDDYTKLCIAQMEEAAIVRKYDNVTKELRLAVAKTIRLQEIAAYRSNLEKLDEESK